VKLVKNSSSAPVLQEHSTSRSSLQTSALCWRSQSRVETFPPDFSPGSCFQDFSQVRDRHPYAPALPCPSSAWVSVAHSLPSCPLTGDILLEDALPK
jgi:hypothetical protein